MDSNQLVESFAEFARSKNIGRSTVENILESIFRALAVSKFGSTNFDIVVNLDKGDVQIWRLREIVGDNDDKAKNPNYISLSEAKGIEADFEVGEEVSEEIKVDLFGRRSIQAAKQMLAQKVRELAREALYNKYKDLVGTVVAVRVNQILPGEVILLDSESNELVLPRSEQIPKDQYQRGELVRAVVHRVEYGNAKLRIVLSRTTPVFLERLFEHEIPEIQDGLIVIKKIVREPGIRAKVAVESLDDRIDPVGACIGIKGSRIQSIIKELRYENIDIINYTENTNLYVARALSPASIGRISDDGSRISIYLDADQIALALGKGGCNIKLASRLIGRDIDVYRDNVDKNDREELEEEEQFADEHAK